MQLKALPGKLFEPRDYGSLVFFRISFGIIVLLETWRYLSKDWVRKTWMDWDFYFPFYGFEWVKPWPGDGMLIHFYCIALLSILIAIGMFYRIAAFLMFLSLAYVFLLDQAMYLNHIYLLILVAFLLVFVPANRGCSVDVAWRKTGSDMVPAWSVALL